MNTKRHHFTDHSHHLENSKKLCARNKDKDQVYISHYKVQHQKSLFLNQVSKKLGQFLGKWNRETDR